MNIVNKEKIAKHSSRVTQGDPKDYSNRDSDHNMNLQTEPARPNSHINGDLL